MCLFLQYTDNEYTLLLIILQKLKDKKKKVWLRKFHSNEYIYVCFFSYIENRSNFWMKV